MDFKVQQASAKVEIIAEFESNNELQIQENTANNIVRRFEANNLTQADPVVIISAVGPPNSRKTGVLNAIIEELMSYSRALEDHTRSAVQKFPEPKYFQTNEYNFDKILVCPPIVVQCNDGRRVGILMMDLWNNSSMSEEVYVKLVEFCFQASSLRIYSLCSPSRPISRGQERSTALQASNYSEQREQGWKDLESPQMNVTTRMPQQPSLSAPARVKIEEQQERCQISHLIAISSARGETGLFQISVMTDANGNERGLTLPQHGFKFIMQQVFSSDNHCCKLSHLKSHVMNCGSKDPESFELIEPQELHSRPSTAASDLSSLKGGTGDGTGGMNVIPDHADIEMMEVENSPENQAATEDIHALITSLKLKPQIDKFLDDYFSSITKTSGHEFTGGREASVNEARNKPDRAALNIAQTITGRLAPAQVPEDVQKFTLELAKTVLSQINRRQEDLQKQMDLVSHTLTQDSTVETAPFVHPASDKLQVQDQAQSPTVQTAAHVEQQVGARVLAEVLIDPAEEDFAKKASKIAIDSVQELLLKYLESHGVLTDIDIRMTFNYCLKLAKKAFISVPGFDSYTTMWKAAWKAQKLSLDERLSQIRRSNNNAIRRWDRALDSALQKSAEFYNQQMDSCLPDYKVSPEQLDRLHDVCVKKTLEQFSASSEIQKPTIDHWNQILAKCKVEEWKEGYRIENETKRDALQLAPAAVPTRAPSTKLPSHTQSSQLPACGVGIYFGPDVIIFKALAPDGAASEKLGMQPYIAFIDGDTIYGEDARARAGAFNVFDILTKFPQAPSQRPSFHSVEINGQSTSIAPEAVAVLFFREALNRITTEIGRKAESCAVAVPGLLSRGSLTAIKAAIKLAGFGSEVTLVPTLTALAMTLTNSTVQEAHATFKKPKKVLAVYHAGPALEVAWIHLSEGKVETQGLDGDFNLLSHPGVDPLGLAAKIIKGVSCKDLSAIVTLIGGRCHPDVEATVRSTVLHLSSTKTPVLRQKVTTPCEAKTPSALADQMAEFCTTRRVSSAPVTRSRANKFTDFNYVYRYNVQLTSKGEGSIATVPPTGTYEYVHKAGSRGFRITEICRESQIIHDFELPPDAQSGLACEIILRRDGSFHIGPPGHCLGSMVYSSSSKLLTTWHQVTVKQNLDHIIHAEASRKEPEISPPVGVIRTETGTKPKLVESRDKLRQLVLSVEKVLKTADSDENPIYEHVSKTVKSCKQLLQNPNSSVEDLESAVEKLKLQEDMLA